MALNLIRQRREATGGKLLSLKLAQEQVQLLREAGQPGRRVKDFQPGLVPAKQGAQRHDPPLFFQHLPRRAGEFAENKTGEPVERENLQARVTGQRRTGQQLALELKRGLFGREQQQRRALRAIAQGIPNLRQATERLPAAGGSEKKPDLHASFFHLKKPGRKGICFDLPGPNTAQPHAPWLTPTSPLKNW
jgi:hypothetical protein